MQQGAITQLKVLNQTRPEKEQNSVPKQLPELNINQLMFLCRGLKTRKGAYFRRELVNTIKPQNILDIYKNRVIFKIRVINVG